LTSFWPRSSFEVVGIIFFGHILNIFPIIAEIGNNEHTEMQLKFQNLRNPSVFITTPTVGRIDLHLTTGNDAVITLKCWVLNEQQQVFA
jgi:hypothetical protein